MDLIFEQSTTLATVIIVRAIVKEDGEQDFVSPLTLAEAKAAYLSLGRAIRDVEG